MLTRGSVLPAFAFAAATTACTGAITGGGGDDDGGPTGGTLAFTAPAPGSSQLRDVLAPDGWLVADVAVAVEVAGTFDAIELVAGDEVVGAIDGSGAAHAPLPALGPVTLTARGYVDGAVVAEATVDVEVIDPTVDDCHGWLDLYQLAWEPLGATLGVDDPIELMTPVNGVAYRYIANTNPRAAFTVMSCELAVQLARAAPYLRRRGVVEVADYGVYNYRCIGSGTPPDCPSGMSQHAYAKAIDLAGFTDEVGTFYSVEDDWVIDPDSEPTCAAPTEPGADTFLHELICELKGDALWNIVLTPNYNAAHRDHFHVDLTPGADYIQRGGPVDTGPDDY